MPLHEVWFVLIAVLFVGFFFLEGFDFGVGMGTQVLARNSLERRMLINTIGPFWDANEVWLITAAGAMFAAFPHWYATMFSGYYVIFALILLALIARAVAFEFRGKVDHAAWKKTWDLAIFVGSIVPPFLFGMIFASLMKGMPIGHDMEMRAGFGDFVSGYTIWIGLTITALCLLHGMTFLSLRTSGDLRERSRLMTMRTLPVVALLLSGAVVWVHLATDLFTMRPFPLYTAVVLGIVAANLVGYFMKNKKEGWAFGMSGALLILTIASVFIGMFPRVMISSLDAAYDLTAANAASSPYTLKMMTIVVVVLLPFVLAYQIWNYYVFRKRITKHDPMEY